MKKKLLLMMLSLFAFVQIGAQSSQTNTNLLPAQKLDYTESSDGIITRYMYDKKGRILSIKSPTNEEKYEYIDGKDGVITTTQTSYENGILKKKTRIAKTRDGYKTLDENYHINEDGTERLDSRYEYTYYANGKKKTEKIYNYISAVDDLVLNRENTYREQMGQELSYIVYDYDTETKQMYILEKKESVCDNNGNVISSKCYYLDNKETMEYRLTSEEISSYDSSNRLTSYTQNGVYDDGVKYLRMSDVYSYISNDEYTKVHMTNSSKDEYGYKNGKEVFHIYYNNFANGEFVPSRKEATEYSDELVKISSSDYIYYNGEWLVENTTFYRNDGTKKDDYVYSVTDGIVSLVGYNKYDTRGNIIESNMNSGTTIYENVYDEQNRLAIQRCTEPDGYKSKDVYNYDIGLEGAYRIDDYRTNLNYKGTYFLREDKLWEMTYMVPNINGGYMSWRECLENPSDSSLPTTGQYYIYYDLESGSSEYDIYYISNGRIYIGRRSRRIYNSNGDPVCLEELKNDNAEQGQGELTIISKEEYVYDETVLGADIAGIDTHLKILSVRKTDAAGNVTNIVYHYSDFDTESVDVSLRDGDIYTQTSTSKAKSISYTRTFNNTAWQALYIPFSMSYDDWKDDFDVACINGIRQLDKNDDGIIDETIMDVIKIKSGATAPNTPYLIKAKSNGEKTLSVSNTALYPAEEKSVDCRTTITEYTFTGTYKNIPSATMIANNYYSMGGGNLIMSDGSNDLKPYRWYMKVESRNPSYNASNAAKTITINVLDEESETTGVEELQMANDESPVYDLNGRKVNENNLKPGIYVKNGKKFIVK